MEIYPRSRLRKAELSDDQKRRFVLEFYVLPRLMTRMDFGDTIIHYSEFQTQSFSLSQNILRRPPETRHNFQ